MQALKTTRASQCQPLYTRPAFWLPAGKPAYKGMPARHRRFCPCMIPNIITKGQVSGWLQLPCISPNWPCGRGMRHHPTSRTVYNCCADVKSGGRQMCLSSLTPGWPQWPGNVILKRWTERVPLVEYNGGARRKEHLLILFIAYIIQNVTTTMVPRTGCPFPLMCYSSGQNMFDIVTRPAVVHILLHRTTVSTCMSTCPMLGLPEDFLWFAAAASPATAHFYVMSMKNAPHRPFNLNSIECSNAFEVHGKNDATIAPYTWKLLMPPSCLPITLGVICIMREHPGKKRG